MEFIAPMVVLMTFALTIGSILKSQIVNRRLRENARAWVDLQSRLVDKFGSAEEVVRYLESDAGRKLVEGQASSPIAPHTRILDSIHIGLLVLAGGVGMVFTGIVTDDRTREFFQTLGTIAILLGAGFLVSAGVSWFLLKGWGLVPSARQDDPGSRNG